MDIDKLPTLMTAVSKLSCVRGTDVNWDSTNNPTIYLDIECPLDRLKDLFVVLEAWQNGRRS